MRQSLARLLAFLVLLATLSACGAGQAEAPTAPAGTAVATSVQAAAPTATGAPTAGATLAPTAAPTATTEAHSADDARATPSPIVSRGGGPLALYPCGAGFCRAPLAGGEAQPIFAAAPANLGSYAFSPDGAQLLYALDKPGADGSATLFLLGEGDAEPRALFDVAGVESGSGGIEGFGVLGFADGGDSIVFEDAAQVFVAAPDGSNRRPVLEQRRYGASSFHTYLLATDGSRVLVVGSGAPFYFEVADIATGTAVSYTLGYDRTPVAFGDTAAQVVVEQFTPPVDQVEGNPATKSYMTLGYELLDLPASSSGTEPLPPGAPAFRDDGASSRGAASNVAAGKLLLRDYERKQGDEIIGAPPALSLLDLRAGTLAPVSLPGYDTEAQGRVWLVAQ
jgi:hypothetical protein